MTATVVRIGRQGRQAAAVERLRDQRDELTAHCAEALGFVDAAWPHVSALERMAIEIGPEALRHAVALGRLLDRYERHHLGDEDAPALALVAS